MLLSQCLSSSKLVCRTTLEVVVVWVLDWDWECYELSSCRAERSPGLGLVLIR